MPPSPFLLSSPDTGDRVCRRIYTCAPRQNQFPGSYTRAAAHCYRHCTSACIAPMQRFCSCAPLGNSSAKSFWFRARLRDHGWFRSHDQCISEPGIPPVMDAGGLNASPRNPVVQTAGVHQSQL